MLVEPWLVCRERPFIWAHRGASAVAPENTMAAFEIALADGADGIECDLQVTADGVAVIAHDERLERTSNGQGTVRTRSLADLQRLDFGRWFDPKFTGEPLPVCADLLDWATGKIWLNLELKDPRSARPLLDLLKRYPGADVLVSSFNWRLLRGLRRADPSVPLAVLSDNRSWRFALRLAHELRAKTVHPALRQVSRPLLRKAAEVDLPVFPWTVDDPRRFATLVRSGVGGVFTNHPRRLLHQL